MDLLKDQYPSDNETEDSENEPVLQHLPDQVLDKFHISPNIGKYTQNEMNSVARLSATRAAKWTSFAFIEMRPTVQQRRTLDELTLKLATKLQRPGLEFQPLHISDLGSPLPLHVSLSANVEFSTAAEVDAFAQMLQIEVLQRIAGPFDVAFEPCLKMYENAERDALFLALDLEPELKNGPLFQLWQAVRESLDFCRRSEHDQDDSNAVSTRTWGHDRSHMSLAKSFCAKASYSSTIVDELNTVLADTPVDPAILDTLKFQCRGIKLTKQRSNLWIPFSVHF
ncbi:LAME_0G07382g1_1 [Lachancea meyersii CBS 8951]|uniref:LAME_0G07382g1_1 n=1 Tax=Lachancea meyersii CBS 8951 TaxID=1266667 RepID=A0A1G4K7X0_9SACH|nr:LAME_0G07382g1_1 [Lachancea meyersii CBS 8951]